MKDLLIFASIGAIAGVIGLKYSRKHNLSPIRLFLFNTTVVCASLVLELVFWEIMELSTMELRKNLWKWLTFTLLCILGFIYPVFHLDTCTPVWVRARSALYFVWIIIGYGIYLLAFMWLSTFIPIAGNQNTASTSEWIRMQLLACNALIGITMMAALCGISSVIAPYTAFLLHDSVTEQQVQQINTSVTNTEELISEEELRLSKLNMEIRSRFRPSSTNLVGRLFGKTDETTQRRDECKTELNALENLLHELRIDKEDMEQRLRSQNFSQTVLGRIVYVVYCVFAVYCVYRLCNSYRRMVWYLLARPSHGESGPRDALVAQIAATLYSRYPSYSVDNWVRIIGIFMSGIVIVTSMNGIFGTLRKLKRRMRPNLLTDPLLISHIFGIYVIACATVLRLNIPKNMSGAIIAALKFPLEVASVQLWNDIILCGTSTVLIAGLLLASRGRERPFDEEMEKYD